MSKLQFCFPALTGLLIAVSGCDNSTGIAESRAEADPGAWRPTWGDVASAKLRPGSWISDGTEGSSCTLGFLFVDPTTQTYYAGTAAHCFNSEDGRTQDGTGRRVWLYDFGVVGTVVFDSDGPAPVQTLSGYTGSDFSLIQLDPGINLVANPEMFSFPGPTGIAYCARTSVGDDLGFYGWGFASNVIAAYRREGVLLGCDDGENLQSVMIPFVSNGDSGGPALHLGSGGALGFLVGFGINGAIGKAMGRVFYDLNKAGFGTVALATIDGGYVAPEIRACTGCEE
ncbi:MAG: hypothetical protein HYV18_01735 [Gammaproteobacteria bacterium]|nr:hypothetical protein [Gammaproteobacteria bacterium]